MTTLLGMQIEDAVKCGLLIEIDGRIADELGWWSRLLVSRAVFENCIAVPDAYSWQTVEMRLNLLLAAFAFPQRSPESKAPYRFQVIYPNSATDNYAIAIVAQCLTDEAGEQAFVFRLSAELDAIAGLDGE